MSTSTTWERVRAELEARDLNLRQTAPKKWHCNSPFRDGSDSGAFNILVEDDGEHGAFYDFVNSDDRGSLYDLAGRLGIQRQNRTRKNQRPEDVAFMHNVPLDVLKTNKWRETTRKGRPALEYPTVTGNRWYFLDGKRPKYDSPADYKASLYGLSEALKIAEKTQQPLTLCNGEFSVLAGIYHGVAAFCQTAGEKELKPENLRQLQQAYSGRSINVVFDSDDTGRRAAPKVAAQLRAAGYDVRVVDLGGDNGYDLADHTWKYGQNSAQALQVLPELQTVELAPLTTSLQDLLNKQFAPVRWVISDYLPEGTTFLAAKPKLGKSWLVHAWCIAIASGGYVFGGIPVDAGDALYLALEDNPRRLQSRSRILLNNKPPQLQAALDIATEWPRADEGGIEMIESWLQAHPNARLVVVDTLIKFRPQRKRGGDIYDEDYEAVKALKELSDRYHVAIVIVHHLRKAGADDPLDMLLGTTGLAGGVGGTLILQRERKAANATLYVGGRDIEHEREVGLRFDATTAQWLVEEDAALSQLSADQKAIVNAIKAAGQPLDAVSVHNRIASLCNISLDYTRKLLQRLADREYLARAERGLYTLPNTVQSVLSDQSVQSVQSVQNEELDNVDATLDNSGEQLSNSFEASQKDKSSVLDKLDTLDTKSNGNGKHPVKTIASVSHIYAQNARKAKANIDNTTSQE